MSGDAKKTLAKRLYDTLGTEKTRFKKSAEAFYAKERTLESRIKMLELIIEAADHVCQSADFSSSAFLKNSLKPVEAVRNQAQDALHELQGTDVRDDAHREFNLDENKQAVFIALFQSPGFDMSRWEIQLRGLNRHMLGRPIYGEEAHVVQMIRSKNVRSAEAYVKLAVDKTHLDGAGAHSNVDKQGNSLINLTPHAVKVDNIMEFVHQGQRYYFRKGKLIKQTSH